MLDPDIRESPLSYGMKRSAPKRKHPRRSELPLNGGAGAAGFEPSPHLCGQDRALPYLGKGTGDVGTHSMIPASAATDRQA